MRDHPWPRAAGRPDLADPGLYAGGQAYWTSWAQLRATHRAAWTESERYGGFWSVTSHELGEYILRHPALFESGSGMRLGSESGSVKAAAQRMLIVSDGATHSRIRARHAAGLNRQTALRLRETLLLEITGRIDDLLRDRQVDIVQRLSADLPAWSVGRILGIPRKDWTLLSSLTAAAFADSDAADTSSAQRRRASATIFQYFAELLEQRKLEPQDDVVSALARPSSAGDRLSDEEVILNCAGLANGGLGTTRHAVSALFQAFAENPDQWELLKANPSLIDSAIEELLRWASPPMHVMRTAAKECRIGEAAVRRGERVVVWMPSCNRDEAIFAEPDHFLITRYPNPHLSLGSGPHYCVGAAVAREELRCLLQVLLDKVGILTVSGRASRMPSNFLHGLAQLNVVLTPAPGIGA